MTIADIKGEIPPAVRLHYKKGELIVKEGDFGISIYRIIKGKVQIFCQVENTEVILAVLGPGEFIGEMAFLSKKIQARSASAKAIQDSELEVWHPEMVRNDYENVAPIIKHMIDETQRRLIRMNRLIVQVSVTEDDEKEKTTCDEREKSTSVRAHYRKNVNLACIYSPVDTSERLLFNGSIKNISLTGINLETREKNAVRFSHDPGDEFKVELTLPNGKDVHATARILALRKPQIPGTLSLGMAFTGMRGGTEKALGFFLMP